jgi:hypothetical protein
MKPLTDAQVKALEAIKAQNVVWNGREFLVLMRARGVRADVVQRVVDKRLARPDSTPVTVRYVELTPSGHAALQEARG